MLRKFLFIFLLLSTTSCESIYSTSSDRVSKSDVNKVLVSDLGVIIDVVPVIIKGDPSIIGALAGAAIVGIASESIGSGSGQEIAIVAGTVAGGVVGYFSTVKLGEHNGFQYVIKIDDREKPLSVIQGASKKEEDNHKIGERVTVIYGNEVKIIKSSN